MQIEPAQRVGMPAFGAAGVKQQVVKIPENQAAVALGWPQAVAARRLDPEENLAIQQQGEQFDSRKTIIPAELSVLAWPLQRGYGGRDRRLENPEQRAGARRLQHEFVVAPSHIGKSRQDKNVGVAERRRCRPIVAHLRFDDDLVRAASR